MKVLNILNLFIGIIIDYLNSILSVIIDIEIIVIDVSAIEKISDLIR